ncbi:MAG TPA: hypothetical protein VF804_02780 [Holophagaceae bacterium]
MISPLTQRQILQTASVEAARLAVDGHAQIQQEQARKQAFDAKLAEAMVDVAEVEEADVLRLTEREGRGRQQGQAGGGGEASGEAGEVLPQDPAEGAGPHLDLLA